MFSFVMASAPQLLPRPAPFARDVDVVVIGDAFVDILATVQAMPQWGQDREASSIRSHGLGLRLSELGCRV